MALKDFYAKAKWRNRWHVKGPHYSTAGHQGFDIAADANAEVPLLRGGHCVAILRSAFLGDYYVIQVGRDDFDGYAHQKDIGLELGKEYFAGFIASRIAGANDFHGSSWAGEHLHLTNGPSIKSITNGNTRDPEPLIAAAISELSITPAVSGTTSPLVEGAPDMSADIVVRISTGEGTGDVYRLANRTAVHLGSDIDVDRAVRLVGRPLAIQSRAEVNTFCAILGIPDGVLKQGVKYFG